MILNQWMRAQILPRNIRFRSPACTGEAQKLWKSLRRVNIHWNEIIILCRWFCADVAKWINIERVAILSTKTAQLFERNFMNYFSSNCFTIGKLALAIKTLSFGERTLTRIFMDRWRPSEMSLRHRSEIILSANFWCSRTLWLVNDPNFPTRIICNVIWGRNSVNFL